MQWLFRKKLIEKDKVLFRNERMEKISGDSLSEWRSWRSEALERIGELQFGCSTHEQFKYKSKPYFRILELIKAFLFAGSVEGMKISDETLLGWQREAIQEIKYIKTKAVDQVDIDCQIQCQERILNLIHALFDATRGKD